MNYSLIIKEVAKTGIAKHEKSGQKMLVKKIAAFLAEVKVVPANRNRQAGTLEKL
jgi:hypothetical protein